MNTNKKKIAIVGAGLAGATLAHQLLNAGCNVTLYEKSRGTGGRIASCRLGDACTDKGANKSSDLGAPFFSPASAEFHQWLSQQASICEWTPITYDFNGAACGLNETNGQSRSHFIATPRQSSLTRDLIQGANLNTSIRVAHIQPHRDKAHPDKNTHSQVLLNDENGKRLGCYDAAIVAAPAKQAAPLLKAVPAFMHQAEAATPTISWVLVIQTSSTQPMTAELIEGQHRLLLRCIKDSAKPGRSCSANSEIWVLEATPEWSALNRDSSAEYIAEQLKTAFFALLSQKSNTQPTIMAERVHRWLYSRHIDQRNNSQLDSGLVPDMNKNPNKSQNMSSGYLWDADTKIGACGDWLESGDTEGAWLSANKLAEQIISELSLI